jgi:hypothetical protein
VAFEPPLGAGEFMAATKGVYSFADPVFVGGQAAVFRARTYPELSQHG